MNCRDATQRLVALRDGELSPSEAVLTEEHVAHCPVCADLDARLTDVTPEFTLQVPEDFRHRFHAELDAAVHAALDEDLPLVDSEPSRWRSLSWLRRDTEMPRAALIAYAALLFLAVGWGLSNWMAFNDLRQQVESGDAVADAPVVETTGPGIPAESYKPASYEPDDEIVH